MTAPVRHSPVRIAPFPNQRQTDNPIQDYCDRLDVAVKSVITALALGFTGYCGYNFYEGFMIKDISPSVMHGLGFVGGMLVTAFMISEVSSSLQQAQAEARPRV